MCDKCCCSCIKACVKNILQKLILLVTGFSLKYFKFLYEGFVKYPFRSVTSSILIISLFIYSLRLYAFEYLYLIKASYFVQDDIVLKLWDAFFRLCIHYRVKFGECVY